MANEASKLDVRVLQQPHLPIFTRVYRGAVIYAIQIFGAPLYWFRDWAHPPEIPPNYVKTYPCRPSLPIRVFFPKSYNPETAKATLPTIFTIHGGGFCFGRVSDNDDWNAHFANMHNVLVVALNYRKAPWHPFPTATYDLEALILAILDDDSLPIDKTRIAIGGFSAGGSLTLSVCQLPSIREKVRPSAAVPIYAVIDKTIPPEVKVKTRYYKPGLGPGMRSAPVDYLATLSPLFLSSYIEPGFNTADPLLSPYFAPRNTLPPHIFFIGTELDQLAHETWCMANKLAGRPEPPLTDIVGQEKLGPGKGELILDDERFAFEHIEDEGKSSVRWLLIPDQIHGFDQVPPRWLGEEGLEDAKLKETAYQKILGEWLLGFVWK
ncbi:alpha/beta-hydrolase [Daldinia vernicosa]|uniref:alpha/beta-hydrolase n=1 Tax=Daldinia vernicosa TaxID=114800 RepID=UPI002007DAC6|nr:alpha/beta-hydrolase [Daldinia vernicosa]KAI0846164.1 alpha/beta-hydrolase [Daldinia vernicosa]